MGAKVLIVDDEQDFTDLLVHNLSSSVCEVLTAKSGLEGLNKARSYLPDVVLLDVVLPDIDGFSICDILRNQPSTGDIPIIVLTALSRESIGPSAIRSGAVSVLSKPVDMNQLRESVAYALSLKEKGSSSARADEY